MLYNVEFISAVQQPWISYIYIHTYIPSVLDLSPTPPHASRSSQRNGLIPRVMQQLPTSYLHMVVYICQCHSLNLSHPLLPLPVSTVCSLRLQFCSCLANLVYLCYFSRFHIYLYIYTWMYVNICFSFSDLIHFVWQTLGSSTSLQMIQFHSFLWLSNSPLYRWPHFLYPFICQWTPGLLPCPGFCK